MAHSLLVYFCRYKFSQNATYSDCTLAATLAIMEKTNISETTSDGKLVADFKSMLRTWKPLLQKMSVGLEEEKSIIIGLETCATSGDLAPFLSTGMSFRFLLQTLHDEEVVSEESILSWAADPKSAPNLVEMKPVQDFIEWLQEEDDDEDEATSSDDDED